MTVFWLDIHPTFQAGFDPALVRRAGCVALVCKVTEGNNWYRAGYRTIAERAMDHDIGFAAYHFLRAESSGASQAQWTKKSMGNHWGVVPIMLDWETSIDNTWAEAGTAREYVNEVRRLGGRITMNYIPRWYWERIGRPSLAQPPFNLLALVQSSYGTNPVGSAIATYPGDQSSRWAGFGGRTVDVLQFGSRCRIPGWDGNLDINARRGTETDLRKARLFHWTTEADDMPEWNDHSQVPADLVAHFPDEANITPAQSYSLAGLLWRAILYPLQIKSTLGRLQTEIDGLRDESRTDGETIASLERRITELVALIRDTGGGNPDTATILEAVRTDGAQTREEAAGAVLRALRQGTDGV